MAKWKHITMFDRPYTPEKQAEGIAVHQAVAEGHCVKCGFYGRCSTDDLFRIKNMNRRNVTEIREKLGKIAADRHQMTNADRIRAMSDEGLAEFLIDLADDGNLRIREWLQQPAEDSANG